MTFSPMPTNLDAARAEILSWRERHKRDAAELRRLHSVNAQLLEALNDIARQPEGDEESAQTVARAAIRARGSA